MPQPFSRRQALAAPLAILTGGALASAAAAPSAAAAAATPGASAAPAVFNNNPLIELQNSGGRPGRSARSGDVTIDYHGHGAFAITSPEGLSVLIDPWRNDPTGQFVPWFSREFPAIPVDLVISTHAHFDHDAVDRPLARMVMLRPVGEYEFADVKLEGLADKHQCEAEGSVDWTGELEALGVNLCPPDNDLPFDNTIQVIETGGLRIAAWGDNRAVPSPALDDRLHDLDVLVLPIDGSEHILAYPRVETIIEKYAPRIVIPAHYANAGLTLPESTLESADSWVATQSHVQRITTGRVVLDRRELRGETGQVLYFGDALYDAGR